MRRAAALALWHILSRMWPLMLAGLVSGVFGIVLLVASSEGACRSPGASGDMWSPSARPRRIRSNLGRLATAAEYR
jgi:hypothetical protein